MLHIVVLSMTAMIHIRCPPGTSCDLQKLVDGQILIGKRVQRPESVHPLSTLKPVKRGFSVVLLSLQ